MTIGQMLLGILGTLLFIGSAPGLAQESSGPERYSFESVHMGTTFRIVAYADGKRRADEATDEAFAYAARLDSLFSDYRPDSEVALLARQAEAGGCVTVSGELRALLHEAQRWSERTGGLFDVTVGPLSRLWRWSARRGALPAPERVHAARAAVGFRELTVDEAERCLTFERPGMSLDLGGIAKGFAADAMLGILNRHGIEAALVDAGGDIVVGAPPPSSEGWRVVLPEGDSLRIADAAVATSGDAERHVVVDGIRYAHIVDPRTGFGVIDAPTVTVVAPDATSADVLASVLIIMNPADGQGLVRRVGTVWARSRGDTDWTAGPLPMHAWHERQMSLPHR
ncbi:MAG: FAD:protein FMN transferase [Longimicrobiales bacterium]